MCVCVCVCMIADSKENMNIKPHRNNPKGKKTTKRHFKKSLDFKNICIFSCREIKDL